MAPGMVRIRVAVTYDYLNGWGVRGDSSYTDDGMLEVEGNVAPVVGFMTGHFPLPEIKEINTEVEGGS